MKALLLILTLVFLGISLVDPPHPRQQPLQHAPTAIALVLMFAAVMRRRPTGAEDRDGARSWPVSTYYWGTAFLWLHILGARYIYSFVPYDEWTTSLFGVSISEWFGWSRNHYDRLVHFAFGVLCVPPASGIAALRGRMSRAWSMGFAVLVVLAISAIYEIFEWVLTLVMNPRNAEAYNGQQGDYWDPQRDMALALAGSLVMVAFEVLGGRTVGVRRPQAS